MGSARSRAHQKFREAARLGQFDIAERFFRGSVVYRRDQANFDEAFVNLQPVLHERNLQFFAAQAATQGFQRFARLLARIVSARRDLRRPAGSGPSEIAPDTASRGAFECGEAIERARAIRLRRCAVHRCAKRAAPVAGGKGLPCSAKRNCRKNSRRPRTGRRASNNRPSL